LLGKTNAPRSRYKNNCGFNNTSSIIAEEEMIKEEEMKEE